MKYYLVLLLIKIIPIHWYKTRNWAITIKLNKEFIPLKYYYCLPNIREYSLIKIYDFQKERFEWIWNYE